MPSQHQLRLRTCARIRVAAYLRIFLSVEFGDTLLRRVQSLVLKGVAVSWTGELLKLELAGAVWRTCSEKVAATRGAARQDWRCTGAAIERRASILTLYTVLQSRGFGIRWWKERRKATTW